MLVTGAAGFIGSHVVQLLIGRGDTVVGIDNLNPYYDPDRKRLHLREVLESMPNAAEKFVLIEGDIRDKQFLQQLFDRYRPHVVIHLAAMAGVRASVDDPWLYLDINLSGTLNLLEMARSHETGNFVMASTSSVYGNTKQIPFLESDTCDRPLAPYPASKRSAEMLGFTYHHLYGLNFTAVRLFTVYGPRNRPDMMASKVLDSIWHGTTVPLYNGGQMYRDWTYVTDIAAGIIAAADRPLGYEIINLGRGEPVLLADFIRYLEKLSGKKALFREEPMPDTDMSLTYADISRAKQFLDYAPQISVEEGTQRLWTWYQQSILRTV